VTKERKRMKIKYKVVKCKTRMSAMINGNSKYSNRYENGDNVYAFDGSLGIFVFETLTEAVKWMQAWNDAVFSEVTKDLTILDVVPLGRGKRVRFISNDIDTNALDQFYDEDGGGCVLGSPPDRSITYPGVHVIGEHIWA